MSLTELSEFQNIDKERKIICSVTTLPEMAIEVKIMNENSFPGWKSNNIYWTLMETENIQKNDEEMMEIENIQESAMLSGYFKIWTSLLGSEKHWKAFPSII